MTAFRSQADEQLAARHDSYPLLLVNGERRSLAHRDEHAPYPHDFAPRIECIPSRDPNPYECEDSGLRMAEKGDTGFWSPRPEYARPPVNEVLTVFREQLTDHVDCGGDAASLARDWMREPWADHEWEGWTSTMVDHARKVLARLANLKGDKK